MTVRFGLEINGAVQGLGFRPFVFRLARELGLSGFVLNTPGGVQVEVEGTQAQFDEFLRRLDTDKPPFARLDRVETTLLASTHADGDFRIEKSKHSGKPSAFVLPEIASCEACVAEFTDPNDRRFGYAFTNCTRCGPRFSIIRALPYDRPETTMHSFPLCAACAEEYRDPNDRRFHAQPNACPKCGPRLWLERPNTEPISEPSAVFSAAADALRSGQIVAIKGLGGMHLLVDANNERAVQCLRERKRRWQKPLALMVPSVQAAAAIASLNEHETAALSSPSAPIMLLVRKPNAPIAAGVAPENPLIGLMLPYSPLHHLLLREFGGSVVATSGNLSEEPICIDNQEARSRLGGIADAFLFHDRPIVRPVDDSVAHFVGGSFQILRRSRGFAPMPISVAKALPVLVAFGGHQKNTVALGLEHQLFLSQHIGDLGTPEALAAHQRVAQDLPNLYAATPTIVAHDAHPDYASTRTAIVNATSWGARLVPVQHHHAHLVSCMVDNKLDLDEPILGVIWDGAGLGPDGTIWGGEFLLGNASGFVRMGHLLPFRLPGGDAAAREPRRAALSTLRAAYDPLNAFRNSAPFRSLKGAEWRLFARMMDTGLNAPWTTSAGRLFDGLAAVLDLGQTVAFEGQAAIALEHLGRDSQGPEYPMGFASTGYTVDSQLDELLGPVAHAGRPRQVLPDRQWILDWRPLVRGVHTDWAASRSREAISWNIHRTLARAVTEFACAAGASRVVLSGGCFQNRLLTQLVRQMLGSAGVEVYIHREIPPNDGGLSAGQAVIAAAVALAMR